MDVPEQLRKCTILIVDDVRAMRDILWYIFKEQKFEHVLRASSEKDAARIINNKTIHLVLTDWMMPRESGLSFVKKLRAQEPELAIIMVTGMDLKNDVLGAMEAGINDYILKPIVPKEVLQKAVAQLGRHKRPVPSAEVEKRTDAA